VDDNLLTENDETTNTDKKLEIEDEENIEEVTEIEKKKNVVLQSNDFLDSIEIESVKDDEDLIRELADVGKTVGKVEIKINNETETWIRVPADYNLNEYWQSDKDRYCVCNEEVQKIYTDINVVKMVTKIH
jgi:SAM-dependent MidA family methyltransferase